MKEKVYPSRLVSGLNEKEWLFTLAVVVLGVPSARAFRLIINPAVKNTSSASMASRLLAEERIQRYAWVLYSHRDQFEINEAAIKYQ